MESLSVGLGNYVSASRVIAIVSPESAPVKRMVQEAKDKGLAIDSTFGRRTRAVIVMDSGQLILSPIQPSTIILRNSNKKLDTAEDEKE